MALFTGVVRNHDRGQGVTRLTYTAHPSAQDELRRVAEKIAASHDVRGVAAVHRLGTLDIGDLAVVVAVASPHRAEAFTACRALIDELKAAVPIWKHQELASGDSEWVNSEWAGPAPAPRGRRAGRGRGAVRRCLTCPGCPAGPPRWRSPPAASPPRWWSPPPSASPTSRFCPGPR